MNITQKITVLVGDNYPLICEGVRAVLEEVDDMMLVGECRDGDEAKRLVSQLYPNILLIDLKLTGYPSAMLIKWIRENYPKTTILVLTEHNSIDGYLASIMDAGAVGYLSKEASIENIIVTIRRAANGEMPFDENQMARINQWREKTQKRWESLTDREKQVLLMILDEKSEKEVAVALSITTKTVEYHTSKILKKLEVNSRREARKWVREYYKVDEVGWK